MAELKRLDTSESIKSNSCVEEVGCLDLDTPRGPVHFCEVQGIMTTVIRRGERPVEACAVLVYHPPLQGADQGAGFLVQLDAEGARAVGASLLKLADQISPATVN